jgi:hypothetical protein
LIPVMAKKTPALGVLLRERANILHSPRRPDVLVELSQDPLPIYQVFGATLSPHADSFKKNVSGA